MCSGKGGTSEPLEVNPCTLIEESEPAIKQGCLYTGLCGGPTWDWMSLRVMSSSCARRSSGEVGSENLAPPLDAAGEPGVSGGGGARETFDGGGGAGGMKAERLADARKRSPFKSPSDLRFKYREFSALGLRGAEVLEVLG